MATNFWELINKHRIEIPSIQRDYAQGRITGKVPNIRKRFLDAIFQTLHSDSGSIELDFVYGYLRAIEGTNTVKYMPLDGQQRLTTLFLLHWYVAYRENHLTDARDILSNFSYATRHSTEVFCGTLLTNSIEEPKLVISKTIVDQKWFFNAMI